MAQACASPFADYLTHGEDLVARLIALPPGASLTLIGLDRTKLSSALSDDPAMPLMLRLDLTEAMTATTAINRILDDLADLAGALWPRWAETETTTAASPLLSSWRRAAMRFVLRGRRPRFPRLARETEFTHLMSVVPGLVLVAEVDPLRRERAAAIIAALEWCRRHAATVVALLAERPPPEPPWDRLLHGAVTVERPPIEPISLRLISPPIAVSAHGSVIERRMREALRAAPDLIGLFEDEITVRLGPLGPTPRVDLLWRDGKVVVELDGAEHERDPNYGADRHRDYELMVAGYLVLRLTNAEVELDLGRSLEKVRRVVKLRRR